MRLGLTFKRCDIHCSGVCYVSLDACAVPHPHNQTMRVLQAMGAQATAMGGVACGGGHSNCVNCVGAHTRPNSLDRHSANGLR